MNKPEKLKKAQINTLCAVLVGIVGLVLPFLVDIDRIDTLFFISMGCMVLAMILGIRGKVLYGFSGWLLLMILLAATVLICQILLIIALQNFCVIC